MPLLIPPQAAKPPRELGALPRLICYSLRKAVGQLGPPSGVCVCLVCVCVPVSVSVCVPVVLCLCLHITSFPLLHLQILCGLTSLMICCCMSPVCHSCSGVLELWKPQPVQNVLLKSDVY